MRLSLLIFTLILLGSTHAIAGCPAPKLTPPESVKINSSSVLIITHATAYYDLRYSIKHGVDSAVKWAKEKNIPVVYLVDDSPIQLYEMEDCQPDYWVRSLDGEVPFKVKALNIYLAGGHLELCLNRTTNELLFEQIRDEPLKATYTYLMDAIYSNGKSVGESDPYYSDVQQFIGVVSYGRPGGEAAPRFSLLEMIGAIKKIGHQYDYLKNILPRWDRSTPGEYEVNLTIKDLHSQTLRGTKGFGSPKVEFIFVESADYLK
jgi:hypothetical protein